MISTVVFDLDDTLYPEKAYARSGLRQVGDHLTQVHGIDNASERLVTLLESGLRGMLFDRLLEEESLPLSLIPQLVQQYRSHRPAIDLYPEVRTQLLQLAPRYRLAIVTDGPLICQRAKVAALDLQTLVELVVCTDEGGREAWKPAAYGYLRVMKVLRVHGPSCVYVGDNPRKDFIGARALGWHTVRVDRKDRLNPCPVPSPAHEADVVVADIQAFAQHLPNIGKNPQTN